ncbi:hypothetical protein F4818DRAFT_246481 [Hypoxylon cercidicola]|nr:hypothetical protein F4818DRAFT_246481 [Hypoxylon cercidicola]
MSGVSAQRTISLDRESHGASETGLPALQRTVRMSYAQSRVWFLWHLVENRAAFNVTTSIRLNGPINQGRLEQALNAVGKRYEALRTLFYSDVDSGQHMQGVMKEPILRLEFAILKNQSQVTDNIRNFQHHVFDLSKGESMRLKLLTLSNQSHVLIVGYHHIVLDGIGLQYFLSELQIAYLGSQITNGLEAIQYPDFAEREFQEQQNGHWSKQLEFWRRELKDLPPSLPTLTMPHKQKVRPDTLTFKSWSTKWRPRRGLKIDIQRCCAQLSSTPFHLYLSVFYALLFRHTNNTAKDICIGVGYDIRKDVDAIHSLGLFLNLIPLRLRCDTDHSFATLLETVKSVSDNAFDNSRVPFSVILDTMDVPRESSRSPVFQAFFNYRPQAQVSRNFCGCEAHGKLASGGQSAYDISMDITDGESEEDIIVISVNKGLYVHEDTDLLINSYANLLGDFLQNSAAMVTSPWISPREGVRTAMQTSQGQELSTTGPDTIIGRIDDMIKIYGDRVALKDGLGMSFTYNQMKCRIGQIYLELSRLGVRRGFIVGIYQAPGADWVCSLLAGLRIGACCVPLDAEAGLQRLLAITNDCRPSVLIVGEGVDIEPDARRSAKILDVSKLPVIRKIGKARAVLNAAKASDTAIISYTSGSTGAPKGILVKHESYRNFVEFAPPRWGFEEGREVVLQQSPYAFDMSIGQIMVCLGYGGLLIIPESSRRRDPIAIGDIMISEGVTFTMGTPTEYLSWIRSRGDKLRVSNWRCALSGGEPMSESVVQAFRSLAISDLCLVNSYGPAEATLGCADCLVPYSENIDLSFAMSPIPNCTIQIVDESLRLLQAGIPGQVVIGGVAVARGYLNQPELTTRIFHNDRHANFSSISRRWTTSLLSGDRGLLDANGHLVIQGRISGSTQIELEGIRFYLEEIESFIIRSSAPFVSQAVVSLRTHPSSGRQFLVAFVVTADAELPLPNKEEFVAHIHQRFPLPQYMPPPMVVLLREMPRTFSNKIDRLAINSLPLHDAEGLSAADVDNPLSDLENALRQL